MKTNIGFRVYLLAALLAGNLGCLHYVRGDLDYIKEPQAVEAKNPKIDYRVNVNYYGVYSKLGYMSWSFFRNDKGETSFTANEKGETVSIYNGKEHPVKEREVINDIIRKFLEENRLNFKEVFNLNPEDLFLNVSTVIHSTFTDDDDTMATLGYSLSLSVIPMKFDEYNVYYAIDVYDKRMLKKIVSKLNVKEAAGGTAWDASGKESKKLISLHNLELQGIEPLGKYEYSRVIIERCVPFGYLLVPLAAGGVFNKEYALKKAVRDMNGEFMEDVNTGMFNQIVSHNLERDGKPGVGGMVMTEDQIGANSSALTMTMFTAAASMPTYTRGGSLSGALKSMGREIAVDAVRGIVTEYLNGEISARLSDEEKNLYVALVKDRKTKKWLFGGAAKSIDAIDTGKYLDKKLPLKKARKYFGSRKEMQQWITSQPKWTEKRETSAIKAEETDNE